MHRIMLCVNHTVYGVRVFYTFILVLAQRITNFHLRLQVLIGYMAAFILVLAQRLTNWLRLSVWIRYVAAPLLAILTADGYSWRAVIWLSCATVPTHGFIH